MDYYKTLRIREEWSDYDKTVAETHLDNYDVIYLDSKTDDVIDNEYRLEQIEIEELKRVTFAAGYHEWVLYLDNEAIYSFGDLSEFADSIEADVNSFSDELMDEFLESEEYNNLEPFSKEQKLKIQGEMQEKLYHNYGG